MRFIDREDGEAARKVAGHARVKRPASLLCENVVAAHPRSLIPVLVTGIQPAQVLGLERLFRAADAALLDLCDEDEERL